MARRKRIYLEPRAVERAHREAKSLALNARISHLFRFMDHLIGMVFASMVFVVGAWTLSVTGPLTSYEKAALGGMFVKALSVVEMSARDLRMAYCDARSCAALDVG